MNTIPTSSPLSAPLPSSEVIGAEMTAQRAALANTITPTGGPVAAIETVGSGISPEVLGVVAETGLAIGALGIAALGIKTMITGKPPWQKG